MAIDIPFAIQQITGKSQNNNTLVSNTKKDTATLETSSLGTLDFVKSDILIIERYNNNVTLGELDTQTITEKAYFQTGDYKITIYFSKKGLGLNITMENGTTFEWASHSDKYVVEEKVHISESNTGTLEVFFGPVDGEIRFEIQKL